MMKIAWVCQTFALSCMLKQLKIIIIFFKNNNDLLKNYIFNIKCTSFSINLLFSTS